MDPSAFAFAAFLAGVESNKICDDDDGGGGAKEVDAEPDVLPFRDGRSVCVVVKKVRASVAGRRDVDARVDVRRAVRNIILDGDRGVVKLCWYQRVVMMTLICAGRSVTDVAIIYQIMQSTAKRNEALEATQ